MKYATFSAAGSSNELLIKSSQWHQMVFASGGDNEAGE